MNKKQPYTVRLVLSLLSVFLLHYSSFAETQKISLKSGLNAISLPLVLESTNIQDVLSPIINIVGDVWRFDPADVNDPWRHYKPGLEEYNDLLEMVAGEGYWIDVKTNVTLQVTGTPLSQKLTYDFKQGWNVIGWSNQEEEDIIDTLSEMEFGKDYIQVSRFNGDTQEDFLNQPGEDDFTTFDPGSVYYIYMLEDKTVTLRNHPPITGTITPSSGIFEHQQPVVFTIAYSDPDGCNDISYCRFLINTSIDDSNCLSAMYDQNSNELYLRSDDGENWLGGFIPCSNNVIENSYVKLDCAQTLVSETVDTLAIKWVVLFKDTFAGMKNIYLYVEDDFGMPDGWKEKGDFCIFRTPILPAD